MPVNALLLTLVAELRAESVPDPLNERFTLAAVLSGKVGLGGLPGNAGVLQEGGVAAQALAGMPVPIRHAAKRSALVAR